MAWSIDELVQRGHTSHRRRGRLDPHRRGAHAAHHQRAGRPTPPSWYYEFAASCRGCKRGRDYEVDEKKRTVAPHREGVEPRSRRRSASTTSTRREHQLVGTLNSRRCKAKELFKRDVDYVVRTAR
jgi:preprotein translocase subunit SecA